MPDYDKYKGELIRLNDTLLYAAREFREALDSEEESEDN